jgi:hypothetical protein
MGGKAKARPTPPAPPKTVTASGRARFEQAPPIAPISIKL